MQRPEKKIRDRGPAARDRAFAAPARYAAPLLFLALAVLLPAGAQAEPGKSGGSFVRIIQSPRAAAMGEAGTGLYGDLLGALALNPAALARTGYREAALVHNSWLEGVSEQGLAYAHPLPGNLVLAGFASVLRTGDIDAYDNSDGYAGTVDAAAALTGASFAVKVAGPGRDRRFGLFAGGGIKYAQQTLDTVSAGTVLYDAGLLSVSRAGAGGVLGLGVSAQSLGQGLKFDSQRDPAPSVFRAGVGYITTLGGEPLSFAFDLARPNDGKVSYAVGAELIMKKIVAWRAGYCAGSGTEGGLRLGAGFILKVMQLDYSMANYGRLGFAHRFSLSHKFGKPVEVARYLTREEEQAEFRTARARKMMAEGRFYKAVLELNEALQLQPDLKEALELMKRARREMETERR